MKTEGKKWLESKLEKRELLKSYKTVKKTDSLAREIGIPLTDIIKLNSNENFFIPKESLTRLMKQVAEECDSRIYPQEEDERLREALCDYVKKSKENIVIGNSSDELIDRIARFFLDEGDEAVSIMPTFPIYKVCVNHQNATYTEVPLRRDFELDVDKIMAVFRSQSRLLFLCSPNNPTANQFKLADIEALIKEFPGIVIVDEAYAEFAECSALSLSEKFENLIVLRTFSKAFGLAGLRLGYAVTSPRLSRTLSEKISSPYPVSSFALRMGLKLLNNFKIVKEAVCELKKERKRLKQELNSIRGIQAFDSKTNFILFNISMPQEDVYRRLLKRGIIIKSLGKILHLNNCLRTTVGLPEMNNKLLDALKEDLRDWRFKKAGVLEE